jgi:hypothetical protein
MWRNEKDTRQEVPIVVQVGDAVRFAISVRNRYKFQIPISSASVKVGPTSSQSCKSEPTLKILHRRMDRSSMGKILSLLDFLLPKPIIHFIRTNIFTPVVICVS